MYGYIRGTMKSYWGSMHYGGAVSLTSLCVACVGSRREKCWADVERAAAFQAELTQAPQRSTAGEAGSLPPPSSSPGKRYFVCLLCFVEVRVMAVLPSGP